VTERVIESDRVTERVRESERVTERVRERRPVRPGEIMVLRYGNIVT